MRTERRNDTIYVPNHYRGEYHGFCSFDLPLPRQALYGYRSLFFKGIGPEEDPTKQFYTLVATLATFSDRVSKTTNNNKRLLLFVQTSTILSSDETVSESE